MTTSEQTYTTFDRVYLADVEVGGFEKGMLYEINGAMYRVVSVDPHSLGSRVVFKEDHALDGFPNILWP
jgi:hypothetical protein